MNVRYRVELSQAERVELTALLSGGKHAARKLKRARQRGSPADRDRLSTIAEATIATDMSFSPSRSFMILSISGGAGNFLPSFRNASRFDTRCSID
jgi:hypothetical protein